MRFIFSLSGIFLSLSIFSQALFKSNPGKIQTFKELQLQFAQFKKTHDLRNTRGWKYFKRYEADMQLHTNGHGEPDGFEDFVKEAVAMSEYKLQNASTASPWTPVGPNVLPNNLTGYAENGIGRVNCVGFHPSNANTFFVGVAQGGLWKTTNGGSSYTCLSDNLPITRISDICINPTNPNNMYVSLCDFEYIGFGLYLNGRKRHTHYGLGVYKTNDGGTTWSATGLTFSLTNGDASLIRKVVMNPSNTNQLLACGVSGMYKSNDAGTSWTKVLDSLFWDMAQDPVNPNVVYAATGWVASSNMGYAAIYKSTNFGASWTMLNTGIPMQGAVQRIKLAIAPNDNNYIYALACDNVFGLYGIYFSKNAGNTWTLKNPGLNILEWDQGTNPGGQGTYDLAMCVNPTNKTLLYVGGINIWMSQDSADTFEPASHWTLSYGPSLHGDIHYLAAQPGTGNMFACSDGGIYKTSSIQPGDWINPWPTVWTNMNSGMQVSSFYRLSSSKDNAGRLVAGAQDNGSMYWDGTSWATIFGGDGMDNYLFPNQNQDIIGSSQYGNFYWSNDGGQTGNYITSNPNNEQAEWTTPIVANYNNGLLYVGNENVAVSSDGGQSWGVPGTIFSNTVNNTNTEISALAVSNTNSNVIWAARRVRYEVPQNGIVFRSTDGGVTYTNVTSNLPDTLYYTGLEVSPTNSNEAVICMAGFSAGRKVYKTTNGGVSWTNISYNLPNLPVNSIKYIPMSSQLIVATDIGVYVLNFGSTNWTNYSLGLPNVIVSDIELNPALNKLYVSTFGRGIWGTDLAAITALQTKGSIATAEFNVYPSVNKGEFTVEAEIGKKNLLEIYDVMGRKVYSAELKSNKTEISLKAIPGTYYVRLEKDDLPGVKKVVVE